MAKNYNAARLSDSRLSGSGSQSYEGTFSGSFIGDLTGNADTATSLAAPFTISLTGDASGNVSTSGKSAHLKVKVAHAAEADHATTADTALNVQTAQTATTAQFATNAATANSASKASVAENANHAKFADESTSAARATYADKSAEADHAIEADTAKTTTHAATADRALVADALANADAPVELAKKARLAHVAEIARYDCMGRSFTNYYALKSELEPLKDALTINQGYSLFVPREEQVLRATVKGRAIGRGVVHGNTLEIMIESVLACNQGGNTGGCGCDEQGGFYCGVIYTFLPDRPDVNADTTKVYVDPLGHMHLWNQDEHKWIVVTSPLDEESAKKFENLKNIIESLNRQFEIKLNNMVTIDGAQTIDGKKTFMSLIESPIADINTDAARTVATIHNVRDVRDHLRSEMHIGYHHIMDVIRNLQDKVNAQARGDILMGGKDYTIYENQKEMVPTTLYLNYLDKNKVYIPADPETWTPIDPTREIVYIRTLVKTTTGHVTWWDQRCVIDPNVWVPWYVDNNGKKHLLLEQGNSLFSTDIDGINKNLVTLDVDGKVQAGDVKVPYNINALDDIVTINGKDVVCTIDELDKYMPKTGGVFTGSISVPNLHQSTSDERVINSYTVHALVHEEINKFNNDLNIHKYMPKAGGTFTGKITVPQSINLTLASDIDVLNKGDVQQLIDMNESNSGFLKLEFCDFRPECVNKMKPNVLYSMPVNDFWKDSDIHSIRLEPDTDAIVVPNDNEGVIYGEKDKL